MRHGGDSEQQRDELSRYPFPPPIRRLDWPGPSDLCVCAVWRYLQEAGFGNAALQLSRCWIRDPDTLPFAKNIEPHTLIRLVQDGMCFDQLQAESLQSEPRYRFGTDHGRPYSARNGNLLTLDKGIPAHQLAAEANGAVQEPPPKKTLKRKKTKPTNGVEPRPEPQVNGDAMDIEHNGAAHVTNSTRAESEPMVSEAESPSLADIPISTLSIGQDAEIQTEAIAIADLNSTTVSIPPPSDPHDWQIPPPASRRGQASQVVSSTAGLINTLRWNPVRNLLLSISTDGEKGSIKVWKNDSDSIPAWTEFTDTAIFDAHWISDSAFVVCGIKLFKIYEVNESLTTQQTLETSVTWETVKYDAASGIIAVLGIEDRETHEYPDEYPTDLGFRVKAKNNHLTNGSALPSVLLATSSMSGATRIWNADEPFKCVKYLPTTDGTQAFKTAFSPDGSLFSGCGT
ncbi:unnamed protein product [Alternaria alternata]